MLFGRSTECGHLEALLDAAASGPVGCILEGTPGIGKSTVWRACLDAARVRRLRVLETAPSEPESVLAFSGLSDLFERLPDGVIDALPEVQAHGLKAALFQGEVPEGVQAWQTRPRAVLSVLRELAATGPILLAIDDEQWLDPASARVLAFVLCRLRHASIAVVLARRSGPRGCGYSIARGGPPRCPRWRPPSNASPATQAATGPVNCPSPARSQMRS